MVAVKPRDIGPLLDQMAGAVTSEQVLLSIAAGVPTFTFEKMLGEIPVVRAMPNTPALVGAGISGAYAPSDLDPAARDAAAAILRAGGDVVWCEREAMLDGVTGVSGSGPAYVFYLLEALEEAGRDVGLPPDVARRLAYATIAGAMTLAQQSDADPATLRAQVTSKGGTTERALGTLEARGVKAAFVVAVKDAAARASEMGDEFGRDD